MYETMDEPILKIEEYLARLGMGERPGADLAGLDALIWAHQTHVPFEDLNTSLYHEPVPLDIPALYDKVVVKRRGGYCFELNALFTRLLKDLGFDARSVFCRVVRGRDFLPPSLHRGVVVKMGERLCFCDVGFGGPMPAGALLIEDGWAGDVRGERFKIKRFDDCWWTMAREDSRGAWEDILQFNTFPQTPQEFIPANYMMSTDPDSVFVKRVMVNLRTPDGHLSIDGDTFTRRAGADTVREPIPDAEALRHVLKKWFDITYF